MSRKVMLMPQAFQRRILELRTRGLNAAMWLASFQIFYCVRYGMRTDTKLLIENVYIEP